jgi:hypothetical protein
MVGRTTAAVVLASDGPVTAIFGAASLGCHFVIRYLKSDLVAAFNGQV